MIVCSANFWKKKFIIFINYKNEPNKTVSTYKNKINIKLCYIYQTRCTNFTPTKMQLPEAITTKGRNFVYYILIVFM